MIVVVVDDERENDLIGKVRNGFRPTAINRSVLRVDALEVIEKTWSGDAAGDAEAGAVGVEPD